MLIKLFLAACLALLPACVSAEETWGIGDDVAAFFVCKQEKDIMDLVMADSKSQEAFASKIVEKKFNQDCIKIFPPMKFTVSEILGSYKDHRKVENTILKIKSPANEMFVGYILVRGIPKTKKETNV
tara:strand:+ start:1307 stop:1687 length:381 start_codon:yes stop_codon:yes gene_type:complete